MKQISPKAITRYLVPVIVGACIVAGTVGFAIETIHDRSRWLLNIGLFCIGAVVGAGFMGVLVLGLARPKQIRQSPPPFVGGSFTK